MSTPTGAAPPLPEDTRSRAIKALGEEGASAVVARIAYWLALSARNDYSEAGTVTGEAYARLRTNNERLIVVAGQLRKLAGDSEFGYPNDAFLDSLAGKAGGDPVAVERAVEKSLRGE